VKRSESVIEAVPTLSDLKHEEERIQQEEEAEVERKRREARQLAAKRGLSVERSIVSDLKDFT
jgi:hypothetical protein